MKIMLNATTAVAGGGAQQAASFIVNSFAEPCGHEFVYAVSSLVMNQVKALTDKSLEKVIEITPSPVQFLRAKRSREKLLKIEKEFKPDIIYSATAPSYTNFKKGIEVASVCDPWFTHPNKLALSSLNIADLIKIKFKSLYCRWWFKKVKYYFVQTAYSGQGLAEKLKIASENIFIVSNCYNKVFTEPVETSEPGSDEKLIFVLTHPYPHKNLDLIPDVSFLLKESGLKFRFVITLPEDHKITTQIYQKAIKLGVKEYIENVGPLTLPECRNWYFKSDIVFLPTLLETFSATYVEAMATQRPLITTDFNFSRDICADAAEYFEPLNAEAAAEAINKVLMNPARYKELVENGLKVIRKLPDPHEQYLLQIKALEKCYRKHNQAHRA